MGTVILLVSHDNVQLFTETLGQIYGLGFVLVGEQKRSQELFAFSRDGVICT